MTMFAVYSAVESLAQNPLRLSSYRRSHLLVALHHVHPLTAATTTALRAPLPLAHPLPVIVSQAAQSCSAATIQPSIGIFSLLPSLALPSLYGLFRCTFMARRTFCMNIRANGRCKIAGVRKPVVPLDSYGSARHNSRPPEPLRLVSLSTRTKQNLQVIRFSPGGSERICGSTEGGSLFSAALARLLLAAQMPVKLTLALLSGDKLIAKVLVCVVRSLRRNPAGLQSIVATR